MLVSRLPSWFPTTDVPTRSKVHQASATLALDSAVQRLKKTKYTMYTLLKRFITVFGKFVQF